MKNKRIIDYIFLILIYFIYSFVNLFAKYASNYKFLSINYMKYYSLEILILGFYAIIWQQIVKKFDLTIAYAWRGTVILWTFLWSIIFFNESITINNIIGSVIIVLGIVVVVKSE